MLYKLLFAAFWVILASCQSSALSKKLKAADSLVITFNYPNTDSVEKTISTSEKKAINKLLRFVDGKETEQYKCGYDGNMIFFSEGEILLPVVFKYSEEGCRYFLFDLDNKVMSTEMSKEAVDFLKSLAEGKAWY